MEDLRVNNESTLINPKGVTSDIVTAVVDCYQRNVDTVPQSLLRIVADSDKQNIAYNIFVWVYENIRYKKDPDGQQWVKTPARLIYDGSGDCKSYSILICSVLTLLGVKNKFRFVSYDGTTNYSHVYPVAIVEGEEIPVDVVALQQKGCEFGNEVEYTNKKDIMNTTKISELSGFNSDMAGTTSLLANDISAAKLVCESFKLVAMATADARLYNKFDLLSEIVTKYETNKDLFKFACVCLLRDLHLSAYDFIMHPTAKSEFLKHNISDKVEKMNDPDNAIEEELWDNPHFAANWDFLEENIFPVLDKYNPACDNVKLGQDLLKVGMCGMYLFIPDNYLTKVQRTKRNNQGEFVEMLISTSVFTPVAALNYIYAGFVSMYRTTPENVFNAMFGGNIPTKYISDDIRGDYHMYIAGNDDDDCYNVEYNPYASTFATVTKAEVVKDPSEGNVQSWISSAVGWFTDIFKTVTGRNSNGNGIIPNYSDNSGSFTGWLILGAALLGGGYLLLRKKRK